VAIIPPSEYLIPQTATSPFIMCGRKKVNRQKIFVAGIGGVGPQSVGRRPESLFNGLYVFKLSHAHTFDALL